MNDRIFAQFTTSFPGFCLKVDINLPGQGVTALFGPSGCGKTTLLRCIAGLQSAEGKLLVRGKVWQDSGSFLPVHQRSLAYVFQEASLFPHLSVKGNLLYGYKRIPQHQRRISFDEAVDWLGLDGLVERKPASLSGGQKQRVAIARALLTSPHLLLMDEPLAALDMKSKAEIFPYLERLHDKLEIPLIYVTHSPEEVARLADYIVVMNEGRVVASGLFPETFTSLDVVINEDDAGVVFPATIVEKVERWHLARVRFTGGDLWIGDSGRSVGTRIRLRILARDVSISLSPQKDSSILNILAGTVMTIAATDHPAIKRVEVKIDNARIIARITKRSIEHLDLKSGKDVWVQIKSVAILS